MEIEYPKRSSLLKRVFIVLGFALGLVIIVGGLFVLHYYGQIDSFLENTQRDFDESTGYSLIAPKHNAEQPVSGEVVAYIATDIYEKELQSAIHDELSCAPLAASDLSALASSMRASEFRLALISEDHLSIYSETFPDFYDWIVVIAHLDIATEHANTPEENTDTTKPFAIYVSGIDTREDAFPFAARSDVNIIMVINPTTHEVLSLSTPRDFFVPIYGKGGAMDKLTHAGIYGVETSLRTLEDFYQIDISYYVRTNFSSLVNVVDTLGGISVVSDRDFTTRSGHTFNKGTNYLDGERALAYARERKAFPEGDRMRGVHQQQIIEAIMGKALRVENLSRFEDILSSLGNSFQTNMPASQIESLAFSQLSSMSSWTTRAIQVDGWDDSRPTYSSGSQKLYVMQPYLDTVDKARASLKRALE